MDNYKFLSESECEFYIKNVKKIGIEQFRNYNKNVMNVYKIPIDKSYDNSQLQKEVIESLQTKLISILGPSYKLGHWIQIIEYLEGMYLKPHVDNITEYPRWRTGLVLVSNSDEFDGGDFTLNGDIIDLKKGNLNILDATIPHGVSEIKRGKRYTLQFPILTTSNLF